MLQVAKMQLLVYDALLQVNTDASTAAASSLDTQLVDITTVSNVDLKCFHSYSLFKNISYH